MTSAGDTSQLFAAAAVRSWAEAVLTRAGLSGSDAATVASSLAFADERGVSTHGVARVPLYVRRLQRGGIIATAKPQVITDAGALCVIDGHGAAGAVTAILAVAEAAARARLHGTGVSLVRGGNDIGAAGYYASQLAGAGCFGMAACNSDAVMCAPGAATPVLGTNPVAVAVPGTALLLDMATSAAAYGKIADAAAQGRAIPAGWGADSAGQVTTDPRQVLDGGCVLPAAGPKGFGLAFMIDALAALAGARTSPFIASVDAQPAVPQDLGMVFFAIDVASCGEPSAFADRVADLAAAVQATTTTTTGSPAMVPGEPEEARRATLRRNVGLPDHLVAELRALGAECLVPFPLPSEAEMADYRMEAR
jgi:LDH2 family malate/lactate/ureidoglycolate dehydrogenase